MQLRDLIRMCVQNLLRRKSRTFLTVLGVLIGCCSIVIMVSIGIGMKETQEKTLSEMGDLTIITVSPQSGGKRGKKPDAAAVKEFTSFNGVDAATPKLGTDDVSIKIYAGADRRYVAEWGSVTGLNASAIPGLGYKLLNGENISAASGDEVLAGQYFEYGFKDTMRPDGANTVDLYSMYKDDGTVGEPPDAYFNALETPLTVEVKFGEANPVTMQVKATGRVKEDYSKGYETSEGLILDLKTLQSLIDKAMQEAGQTINRGKSYSTVLVKVSGIEKVAEVEQQIKKMGFQTSSMESIRKPMEKEAHQKQLMLGGLGAISLFVAALGITNTMIMSISERTREIGIMKSLGCYVHDVRALFLMEAGAIGLIGGIVGSVISMLVSVLMNIVSNKASLASLESMWMLLTTPGSRMSVIPPWLIAFAVVFSICIGLGSGYYPANKAVKIPALEAIKSD